ncbi:LEM domain-containing protein 1 isoform 2-T2 [Odontesthes bonariensis]|uniref:LEM domain-containing protein 1 isoform X2 n=1 Tax=Odontesthes bonariensis TaxID=219752 RepID=UPI003F583DE1
MPFVEDPARFSKTRLKSDLIAHNVELPHTASTKETYVELHLKHIDPNAADFSSDDEEPVQEVADKEESSEDAEMPHLSTLTDDDLKATLLKHGVKAGPIVASTRALYERKLRNLLQCDGHDGLNGAEKAVLYSDSEEEGEGNMEEEEKESEQKQQETVEKPEQTHQQRTELPPEPVKDILKDLIPDIKTTPTGIYVTSRRPIKGAAQRPVLYAYPDTPVSPVTLQRREEERHLVPIHIQILVFLILAFILYFIYVNVEDSSSVLALLDSLNQWSDMEEGALLQAET